MGANFVGTTRHSILGLSRDSVASVSKNNAPPSSNIKLPSSVKRVMENDSIEITQQARKKAGTVAKNEGSADFQRKLSVTGNKQVVMKLIDPQTKNVVRQIPPEDLIRLQEAIRKAAEEIDV
tara:strand:+ start:16945 stop:17310 length:366 start_codon:yes stop_codon:yes gene_type:complete